MFTDLLPQIERAIARTRLWYVISDAKKEHVRALKRIPVIRAALEKQRIRHSRITDRARHSIYCYNRLFSADYIDREIRKDMGDHAKESVKYAREINCALERLVIKLGSHTFTKPHRITGKVDTSDEPRHAEVARLTSTPIVASYDLWLYTHRHVFSHLPEEASEMDWIRTIWKRTETNPPIIDLKTGEMKRKGQPKEKRFARHLFV
ncbi:MAG: hypothetical protein EA427_17150 [Spirochaetaceae bacterium]|nr:MAG: hypothetical protein EA427_17150 [Spirochaetaceae bacterium]